MGGNAFPGQMFAHACSVLARVFGVENSRALRMARAVEFDFFDMRGGKRKGAPVRERPEFGEKESCAISRGWSRRGG